MNSTQSSIINILKPLMIFQKNHTLTSRVFRTAVLPCGCLSSAPEEWGPSKVKLEKFLLGQLTRPRLSFMLISISSLVSAQSEMYQYLSTQRFSVVPQKRIITQLWTKAWMNLNVLTHVAKTVSEKLNQEWWGERGEAVTSQRIHNSHKSLSPTLKRNFFQENPKVGISHFFDPTPIPCEKWAITKAFGRSYDANCEFWATSPTQKQEIDGAR